jgi:hypothetical protein
MDVWVRAESAKEGEVLESMVRVLFLVTWNGMEVKSEREKVREAFARLRARRLWADGESERLRLRQQYYECSITGICSRRAQRYPPSVGLRDVSE